jgi:LytS/YehU family sensor histidine kinase
MLNKLPFHIIFWLISLNLCAFIIGYKSDWQQAYLLTAIYSPVSVSSAYFITHVLMERYLYKGSYLKFIIYLIYTITVSLFLVMVLNTVVFINIANYQFNLMPAPTKDIVVLFTILYLIVFLFVSTQSVKKYADARSEKEAALKRMAETELKFLKSQLNPHFLFNTLNNLYSLAVKKSDEAPDAILKLSNLLDNVLSASDNLLIPIDQELKVIEDFIYLESLRFGDRLNIKKEIEVPEGCEFKIPPLSLITIIENCFKHGGEGKMKKLAINIKIIASNNTLNVATKNNYHPSGDGTSKGRGLDNLRRQMNYLFKDKHELTISQRENIFTLELNMLF